MVGALYWQQYYLVYHLLKRPLLRYSGLLVVSSWTLLEIFRWWSLLSSSIRYRSVWIFALLGIVAIAAQLVPARLIASGRNSASYNSDRGEVNSTESLR